MATKVRKNSKGVEIVDRQSAAYKKAVRTGDFSALPKEFQVSSPYTRGVDTSPVVEEGTADDNRAKVEPKP